MKLCPKKEFWFVLLLSLPTLIVAGLYKNTESFSVMIRVDDPEQCGGIVTPSGLQTLHSGDDLAIRINLGDCGSWEGSIQDTQGTVLYETAGIQSSRLALHQIMEAHQVFITFHATKS